MDIAEIALMTGPASDVSGYQSRNMAQAVGVEFDAMLIGLLLQAGGAHALDTEATTAEMGIWNDLFVHSLARELARSGELGFSQSLLTQDVSSGGGNHD
jgi:hypothetical protein